jgi:hypothetical protein
MSPTSLPPWLRQQAKRRADTFEALERFAMRGRLSSIWAQHQDLFLLTTLVSAFFVMALALLRPGGYILEWWGYYMPHTGFVRLSDLGLYPYIHYWMEYPPLLSWLPILAYRLSHLLPTWNHPWLWYNSAMGLLLLPFEIGNLVLVYLIALKVHDRSLALRCAVFYALLFAPLFTWLGWFDCFPLFFLLMGLYLLLLRKPVLAGLVTGAGFMTKVFPLLLLPVGWRVFQGPRRRALLYIVATALAILLIALPFLLIRADLFVASFINMVTRPSWETIWALFDGYYTGGLVAPLDQRFDPGTASQVDHVSNLPWPLISLGFALLYLLVYTRRIVWRDAGCVLTFCGLSLNLFMLYSKGYSPQFLVYILPFVVLLLPNLKGVAYVLLLTTVNYLDWPVAQLMLPNQHWLFASAVVLRTLLLVTLSVEYSLILFPAARSWRFWRPVLALPLLLSLGGMGLVGGLALRAYSAEQYARDPYSEVMDFLREQQGAGVVIADESLYQRFLPHLGRSVSLRLMGGDEWSLQRLEKLATKHELLWLVEIGTESEQAVHAAISRWLSERCFPLGSRWFENARLNSYATGELPPSHTTWVDFQELVLTGYGTADASVQPGEIVRIALLWQPLKEMDRDYSVFIHLVGPDGQIRGQHDGQPVGGFRPTSSWRMGQEIPDQHALYLAPGAPPGEYWLVVGLYDGATGQRLLAADENGEVAGDSVLLQKISVSLPTQ